MARLVNKPLCVLALRGGAPAAFVLAGDGRAPRRPLPGGRCGPPGGRAGRVLRAAAVLDEWRETGRWWAGEGEKRVYRLLMEGGGVWEVEQDEASGRWFLYKVYD